MTRHDAAVLWVVALFALALALTAAAAVAAWGAEVRAGPLHAWSYSGDLAWNPGWNTGPGLLVLRCGSWCAGGELR